MAALRVLRAHCINEEQFMQEVSMLGLDELLPT